MPSVRQTLPLFALCLAFGACTESDPSDSGFDAGDTGADVASDTGSDVSADMFDLGSDTSGVECEPLASDYSPGDDDEWDACISDDGEYHRIEQSISTIGRIAGFEQIADLLWRNADLTAEDFVSARDVYATGEGLDSRIQRREDEHYPPVTDPDTGDTLRCRDEGVPEMDPDRCVGPALIAPLLNDAFREGIAGTDMEVNAARIEAALLWFLYVSPYKEATTCALAAKDCDSSYAYYTGGAPQDGGLGLSSYVHELAPATHDRVWDGILAVRCWRDLDSADEATNLDMQARALAQLDRALLHGLSRIVIDRIATWANATGTEREAAAAVIGILGPVLDREAGVRDPDTADDIAAAWGDFESVDPAALVADLDAVFPCP